MKLYTVEEALALIGDLKLSKFKYIIFYLQAKERNADIYPFCNIVGESKKDCYCFLLRFLGK